VKDRLLASPEAYSHSALLSQGASIEMFSVNLTGYVIKLLWIH
jgi:hypothetical protein